MKHEKSWKEKQKMISSLNIMDDVFFQKIAESTEVCEEMLRVMLGDESIKVIESKVQASLKNTGNKSVVLDLLCTDRRNILYNVEVQKSDDDNHQKRVRYNGSNIDTSFTEKGVKYENLPTVYVIFVSKFDVFKGGFSKYHVDRIVRETGQIVDNGFNEIYINTKADDGSEVAELMRYFKNSNGYNPKFPKISERVDYFKNVREGVQEMSSMVEQFRQEGRLEERKEIVKKLLKKNIPVEIILETTGLAKEELERIANSSKN